MADEKKAVELRDPEMVVEVEGAKTRWLSVGGNHYPFFGADSPCLGLEGPFEDGSWDEPLETFHTQNDRYERLAAEGKLTRVPRATAADMGVER